MDRKTYLSYLIKVADPVLWAAAEGKLRERMMIESVETKDQKNQAYSRSAFSYFEGVARLLCGMTPWLYADVLGEEEQKLQLKYRKLAIKAIDFQTNQTSPDYANFEKLNHNYSQILVDCAFLAQAFIRAPKLLTDMEDRIKNQILRAFKLSRKVKPYYSNWILFSAMVEAGIELISKGAGDIVRVDYAYQQMEQWYTGDGFYTDGPDFAIDYYNSYVIHPMLLDVMKVFGASFSQQEIKAVENRAKRHAEFLERMICPDGSFIVVGRSITYRCGAFHLLAQLVLLNKLPDTLSKAQVRCGLGAVIEKTITKESFREDGFLCLGLCAKQPSLAEIYISTGSLYLCSVAFLPLGLSDTDEFFTSPDKDWTQKQIWSGIDKMADHKLY